MKKPGVKQSKSWDTVPLNMPVFSETSIAIEEKTGENIINIKLNAEGKQQGNRNFEKTYA